MPTYPVPIGASGENLDIKLNFLGTAITLRGEKLKTKYHLGLPSYRSADLQTSDGQNHPIEIRMDYMDVIPRIVVDGAEAAYRPPIPTWAKALAIVAFALLPIGVCFVGGWLSGLVGALAGYAVLYMARAMENKSTATLLSILTVVAAWVFWAIFSIAALALIMSQAGSR